MKTYSTAEVAEISGRHKDNVLLAARRGLLPSIQASPYATRRYRETDVGAWIERGAPYVVTARLRVVANN